MKHRITLLVALLVLLVSALPASAQTDPPPGSQPPGGGSSGSSSGSSGDFVTPLDWGDSDGDGIPNFYEPYLAPMVGNPGCNYPAPDVFDPNSTLLDFVQSPGMPAGWGWQGVITKRCYQVDARPGTEPNWYAVTPMQHMPDYDPQTRYPTVYWSYQEAQQQVFYSGVGGLGMIRLDMCTNAIEPTILAFNLLPLSEVHPVAQALCGMGVFYVSTEGMQRVLQAQWQTAERLALSAAAADAAANRPPSFHTRMMTMYARAAEQAYIWSLTIGYGGLP